MKNIVGIAISALVTIIRSMVQTLSSALAIIACPIEPKIVFPKNTRWYKFLIDNHFTSSRKVQFSVEETNVLRVCVSDNDGGEHSLYFKIVEDGPNPHHFIVEEVGTNLQFKNEAHLCDFLHRMIAHPRLIDGGPITIRG